MTSFLQVLDRECREEFRRPRQVLERRKDRLRAQLPRHRHSFRLHHALHRRRLLHRRSLALLLGLDLALL